jgi:hypothetical protein
LKKIDLHIHTVQTISDRPFTYSLDTFKRYVAEAKLDAVAVTNHDRFDGAQFREIRHSLGIAVFPGIEINVEGGHLLVIADAINLEDFETQTARIAQKIVKAGDGVTVQELKAIFGDLNDYLLIPHYEKGPPISAVTLEKLKPYVFAGEVDSAKKFFRLSKDTTRLTPVLFSDGRMQKDLERLPTRQTYIDCGSVTLDAIRACLRDRTKVVLSESDGNKLWQALPELQLSTGLNVLLGARSTGKTHTLDEISKTIPNARYIRQFELVQQDDERDFKDGVAKKRGAIVEDYLSGLKAVLDEVVNIDLEANNQAVEQYVTSLVRFAEDTGRQDLYSNTALFSETEFSLGDTSTLDALIRSVEQVIENAEFRHYIERHVELRSLHNLILELIELQWDRALQLKKKKLVNGLVRDIKSDLSMRSSATQVDDVDLYKVTMDENRIQRFRDIVRFLRCESIVSEQEIRQFRIEAKQAAFAGAGEIKEASRSKGSFGAAFKQYPDPYEYLRELLKIGDLNRADLHKLFAKIDYRILNKDGVPVSGGERSEFRLLEEIADAQKYDVLLLDEPESSFDNPFLSDQVNKLLKDIAAETPVVVVTHNNSVGASVGADYLLYTRKEWKDGKTIYRVFSGYPSDKMLVTEDGEAIKTHEVLMNSLEAGVRAYESRREGYEATKG